MASLIIDFLQVFNLDFTLAVFQPEINSVSGLLPDVSETILEVHLKEFQMCLFGVCVCLCCAQLNGLDSREQVSRELSITETDVNRNTPLLLELIKRSRHKEKPSMFSEVNALSH